MSLVGPSINKVHSQHMVQQEERLLQQYVRDVSMHAFHAHKDIQLMLNGGVLKAVFEDSSSFTPEAMDEPSKNYSPDTADAELPEYRDKLDYVLEQEFDYLRFETDTFSALKNGEVTQDIVQVSVGSVGIIKDISVRGIVFTEYWQANE